MIVDKSQMKSQKVVIDLTGPAGNAFSLMGHAKTWAKQLGYTTDEIKEMLDNMMAGDYDHLLEVFDEHFGSFCTLYK